MGATPTADAFVADAEESAARAAARAGVDVRELGSDVHDLAALVELFCAVWSFPPAEPPLTKELLRAMSHAGNYVAGAFDGPQLVGASVAFLGWHDGQPHLHSHISGVHRAFQGRDVGFALKQHQRAWALRRGIPTVVWTFDPLVRRNAYFNVAKLRAEVVDFRPDFYGPLPDGINNGDASDRAVVAWSVASPGAAAAARGDGPSDGDVDSPTAGAVLLTADGEGRPVVVHHEDGGGVLRVWIPEDIVALRRSDPVLAQAWRRALRESFGAAVAAGYTARAITRDGWYTLSPATEASLSARTSGLGDTLVDRV